MTSDDDGLLKEPQITIELASEADIAGIQLAAAEAWRAAYSGIYSSDFIESFVGRAYSQESLRRIVQSTRSVFVVARSEGEVVGFSHAGYGPRMAELYRVYLRPRWWGSEVADKLLQRTEEWMHAEGYAGYGCYVHSRNVEGRRFYERQDFRRLPEYDEGDEQFWWKDL